MANEIKKSEHIVMYRIEGDDLIYHDDKGKLTRCKDCAFAEPPSRQTDKIYQKWYRCKITNAYHTEDWFCADAEVKNE